MSSSIDRVHYSHYWVRNWGAYRPKLSADRRRRETERWETAVANPVAMRQNQISLVAQATNRRPDQVLEAWGLSGG